MAVAPADAEPPSLNVLYVSYTGLAEPLGRRQVLPYLTGLAKLGWRITVLSYEKDQPGGPGAALVQQVLTDAGVEWWPLRYHQRPAGVSKAVDLVQGAVRVLHTRRRFALVHARSTVSAALAYGLARRWRVPWIFDVRGLLAQEYADAGHWLPGDLLHALTARAESWLMRRAPGLVFLTDLVRRDLSRAGALAPSAEVVTVPCCVDTQVFRPDGAARARVRGALGLGDAPVITYSGTLGSWYRLDEMLAFFAVARRRISGLRFLLLTGQAAEAQRAVERAGLAADTSCVTLAPDEVPDHLAAADAGICFLANVRSKRASSPTKFGEYLAAGLPVVATRWTGDAETFADDPAWVLVDGFGGSHYERAAARLASILGNRPLTTERARSAALRHFSLQEAVARYHGLYRTLVGREP